MVGFHLITYSIIGFLTEKANLSTAEYVEPALAAVKKKISLTAKNIKPNACTQVTEE